MGTDRIDNAPNSLVLPKNIHVNFHSFCKLWNEKPTPL